MEQIITSGLHDRLISFLRENVFSIQPSGKLFNQWGQFSSTFDEDKSAPDKRRENLEAFIRSIGAANPYLLVGEAPGFNGCRFSGVAFTCEAQLLDEGFPFRGKKTGKRKDPYVERSATIFWSELRAHHGKFFVWNAVPFHPWKDGKKPGKIINRGPIPSEIDFGMQILSKLIAVLAPAKVIAIGRIAETVVNAISPPAVYVRHMSFGGEAEFRAGISSHFE